MTILRTLHLKVPCVLRGRGFFGSGYRSYASGGSFDNVDRLNKSIPQKQPAKKTRQERIDRANLESHSKLIYIDKQFGIFDKSVKTVLDIGYVPGNWSAFAKNTLLHVHSLPDEQFNKTCHIAGVDILFGTPPLGVSSIQGNIFSQSTHDNIISHFKEVALRRAKNSASPESSAKESQNIADEVSYLDKEQDQVLLEQLEELSAKFADMSLGTRSPDDIRILASLKPHDYQPDVIMSDLSAPFMQSSGFFNNTSTRPYIRTGNNIGLNDVILNASKATLDLADASLLLTCSLLKQKGKYILRLGKVDLNDPELILLEKRLNKVFANVSRWSESNTSGSVPSHGQELFFICTNKLDHIADKFDVFVPDSLKR